MKFLCTKPYASNSNFKVLPIAINLDHVIQISVGLDDRAVLWIGHGEDDYIKIDMSYDEVLEVIRKVP